MRMSKMDYQTLKDEQESLRAAYEREKTNELLFGSSAGEGMSPVHDGRPSALRRRGVSSGDEHRPAAGGDSHLLARAPLQGAVRARG